MRNAFAEAFLAAARKDDRLRMVVADISAAEAMDEFRREFPDRFINVGVAEQSMIGLCAGMAMKGLRPIAYTIAPFVLFRPYEFVRDDLCYQNLPVTLVGIGGGVTYNTLGGTHHAMEDVALACNLPNMRVFTPAGPSGVTLALEDCLRGSGPAYLRLGKTGEQDVRANLTGSGPIVIGYGPIMALAAGIPGVSVMPLPVMKPFPEAAVRLALNSYSTVIVLEEGVDYLGVRVKAMAWEMGAKCRIATLALKDEWIHAYGPELLRAHGLARGVIEACLTPIKAEEVQDPRWGIG